MANAKSMTKTTTRKSTDIDIESGVVEEVKTRKVEKKKYDQEDLISCRSMVSGGLHIIGDRSGFLYSWADYGDVIGVEYRDLVYLIRSNHISITEPRIIIEDEDIVKEFKTLSDLYDSLYSVGDLQNLIKLPLGEMKKQINALPNGAKNAFKDLVADMIGRKALDSVTKIKAIDEIFGTSFLLTLSEE